MNLKKHTMEEVERAFESGKEVWKLEAESPLYNEFFIGKRKDVLANMLEYYELEEFPKNWELVRFGADDLEKLKGSKAKEQINSL